MANSKVLIGAGATKEIRNLRRKVRDLTAENKRLEDLLRAEKRKNSRLRRSLERYEGMDSANG